MKEQQDRVFARKHDFYYSTLLIYVVFAVAYILVTGTVTDEYVQFGFRDPVVYIIGIFILHAVVMLIVSIVRNQRLVLGGDRLAFKSRFKHRDLLHDDIRRITLKRERKKFNDGTYAVVVLRMEGRRRPIRIRVANYEREKELYQLFKALKHDLKK